MVIGPGDFPELERGEPPEPPPVRPVFQAAEVGEIPIVQILEEELIKVQGWIDTGVMTQPEAVAYLDQFEARWEAIGMQREQQVLAERVGAQQEIQKELDIQGRTELGQRFFQDKEAILTQDTSYQQKTSQIQSLVQEFFAKGVPRIASVQYQRVWQGEILRSLSTEQRGQAVSLGQLDPRTFTPLGAGEVARPGVLAPARLPEFEPVFAEVSATVTGPQRARDFFQARFPEILRRFQALQPDILPAAEEQEESFAKFLRKRIPQIQEEFAGLGAFRRGERPGVFAPRIKTVGF